MFDNQSKTESLLQLSVPQDPLLLHPLGVPSLAPVEQFVHAIIEYILIVRLLDYVSKMFLSVKILIFYGNFQKSISKLTKKKKPISW
jgi:hypothetical protein